MQYAEKELTETAAGDSGTVKVTEINSYTGKNKNGDTVTKKIDPIKFKVSDGATKNKFKIGNKDAVDADIDLYIIGISTDQDTVDEYQNTGVTRKYDSGVRYKFLLPKNRN
jgi:hypothetical protein